ncbi:hypothetical protein GCM10028825_13880 [Spirosoma agri]
MNLYLTWHEQHPNFPYTVVPAASQLQPIREGLDAMLNARYGLDGMTPIHA